MKVETVSQTANSSRFDQTEDFTSFLLFSLQERRERIGTSMGSANETRRRLLAFLACTERGGTTVAFDNLAWLRTKTD